MLAIDGGKQGSETLFTAAAVCSLPPPPFAPSTSSFPTPVVFHLHFLKPVRNPLKISDWWFLLPSILTLGSDPVPASGGMWACPLGWNSPTAADAVPGARFKRYADQAESTSLPRRAATNLTHPPASPRAFLVFTWPLTSCPHSDPNLQPLVDSSAWFWFFSPFAGFKFTAKPRSRHVGAVLLGALRLCLLLVADVALTDVLRMKCWQVFSPSSSIYVAR